MEIDCRKTGYRFSKGHFEFFCFKEDYPELKDDESVYVTGTFNGWVNTGDSSWLMKRKVEKGNVVFVLEKDVEKISVPGNSGFPEFKFFALSNASCHMLAEREGAENIFLGNKLILLDEDDILDAKKLHAHPDVYKSLEDFDSSCPSCRAEVSNFRRVPATRALFRGYHPYKRSRDFMDTEDLRIKLVEKGLSLYGIKSDITLSGFEVPSERNHEVPSEAIRRIEEKNNRLCVNVDYNLVYFHSDAAEYINNIQKISRFMLDHPGPFYLHCRLGSDRTGVTAAVFAALCGASWEEIAVDFERTNDCGIGEYRSRRLLQYSLRRMIGYDPCGSRDLGHLMQSFFLKENILKAPEIEKLIKKLNTDPRKKETDYFDFSGRHICAKKSANR